MKFVSAGSIGVGGLCLAMQELNTYLTPPPVPPRERISPGGNAVWPGSKDGVSLRPIQAVSLANPTRI